ncbi:hypothetical protein [Helicobacter sp. 11S02596-1]|uniref:hypothetical protein n=1 Tax=Helicobacter sp. 11S02596-1 TaxID=1476194 RepID=UPI000BA6E325|nr:hypothetical protein [Helicobacter sp. 11S02596-1]PAF44043.1 hypothetical protein BJI48_04480 [Helicobacter sp. 11S02596-1]
MAIIFGGKPRMPAILPRRLDDGRIELGRVIVRNQRWWNAFPISFAPLLLLGVGFLLQGYYFYFFEANFVYTLLYLYLVVTILESAIPSTQDMKNAISSKIGILVWVFLLLGGGYFYYCFS